MRNRSTPGSTSGSLFGLGNTTYPNLTTTPNPYPDDPINRSPRVVTDGNGPTLTGKRSISGTRSNNGVVREERDNRNRTTITTNPSGQNNFRGDSNRNSVRTVNPGGGGLKSGLNTVRGTPNNKRSVRNGDRREGVTGSKRSLERNDRERVDQSHRRDGDRKDHDPNRGRHGDRKLRGDDYHKRSPSHWTDHDHERGYHQHLKYWRDRRYYSGFYRGLTYSHRWGTFGYYYGPFILIDGYRYYSRYYYDNYYYDDYYDDIYYDNHRSGNRVILYEDSFYRGHNLELYAGQSIADLSHYLTTSDRSFNDLISSVKVYGEVTLVLYKHANFYGDRLYLHISVGDFSREGFVREFQDEVSSIEVLPGRYNAHGSSVYESDDYLKPDHGDPTSQSGSYLDSAGAGQLAALPPEPDSVYAPGNEGADRAVAHSLARVIIFDQPNFRGNRLELSAGDVISNLAIRYRDVGSSWDDSVASIQVLGGAEVFIYTGRDFYGEGIALDHDVVSLSTSPSLTQFAGSISSIVVKHP